MAKVGVSHSQATCNPIWSQVGYARKTVSMQKEEREEKTEYSCKQLQVYSKNV